MPSMLFLKVTPYHRFVTQKGYFIAFGHWIHIHTVFRKRGFNSNLRRMPEQGTGSNQNHFGWSLHLIPPLDEPILDL